MKVLRTLGIGLFIVLALASMGFSQKWQPVKTKAPVPMGAILLLTDGTVMAHQEQQNAQNWYKLTRISREAISTESGRRSPRCRLSTERYMDRSFLVP